MSGITFFMGTKNNPGAFDCYTHADPDEPMFVLLGRDPMAPLLVELWQASRVVMAAKAGQEVNVEKMQQASRCANQMQAWALALDKEKDQKAAVDALMSVMGEAVDTWRAQAEVTENG